MFYVTPPLFTTPSQTLPWSGSTDLGGGEDEHGRGIEMTKNKVEIHLFYLNISIIYNSFNMRLQVRGDNQRGLLEKISANASSVSVLI